MTLVRGQVVSEEAVGKSGKFFRQRDRKYLAKKKQDAA